MRGFTQRRDEKMKQYSRYDAKAYARAHMKGIWAAALVPFNDDLTIDDAHRLGRPASNFHSTMHIGALPPAVRLHPRGSRCLETRYIWWVAIRQHVAVGRASVGSNPR
jgi:hypothetical protein